MIDKSEIEAVAQDPAHSSVLKQIQSAFVKIGRMFTWTTPWFLTIVFVATVLNYLRLTSIKGGWRTTFQLQIEFAESMTAEKVTMFHGMFFQTIGALYQQGVPIEIGATLFLGGCVSLVAYQTYLYLSRRLEGLYSAYAIRGITAITLVINAIYLPFLTRGVYLGQWGPNVYHNATVTTIKMFSIPIFVLIAALLIEGRIRQYWQTLVLTSVLLCLSLYAKPTLFLLIGPGAVLYALCVNTPWRDRIVTLAVLLAPSVVFLAYQRYAAYGAETSPFSGRWTEFAPFWVWRQWTKSVPVSILLTLAFPIAVTYVTRRERSRSDHLNFAWILLVVGFLQAALLVEVHPVHGYMRTANWFGVYLLATHLLFIVCCAEFFSWYGRQTAAMRKHRATRLAWGLLALHVLSGIVYLIRLSYVGSAHA